MGCEILISRESSKAFGEIIYVALIGHEWSALESKKEWIAAGNPVDQWPGDFFVLVVPDMQPEEAREMKYKKHLFRLQGNRRVMRDLDLAGEATITRSDLIKETRDKASELPALYGQTGEKEPYAYTGRYTGKHKRRAR